MNAKDVKNYYSSKTNNKYTEYYYYTRILYMSTLFIDSLINHGMLCELLVSAHMRVVHQFTP
jgi:hypothetical protein